MEFTSLYFIFLSLASFLVYYLVDPKFRVPYLVLVSCCFIASYDFFLLIYVIVFSLFNFYLGLRLSLSSNKKLLANFGIIVNITQLFLLKYLPFSLKKLSANSGMDLGFFDLSNLIIPVGISFFTLQAIGYLININMGWEKPEKNFLNYLLYIIFFPKFLSGPIERSNHFLPQLRVVQKFDEKLVVQGFRLILLGLFKKVAIANQLAPLVSNTYSNIDLAGGYSLWIVLLIQPLYLYFDFSGYTDIALGIARTFGIDLLPNFKMPFLSENVTTFWKRFHISLSSWFNDYIFRRISFRRRKWGIYASVYAVFVTWGLFGIWHGAGWNFMLLGLLQAFVIIYEFFTRQWRTRLFSRLPSFLRILTGRVLTYIFYAVSLVFFFSPDVSSVFDFFSKLTDLRVSVPLPIRGEILILVFGFILIFILIEIIQNDFGKLYQKLERSWLVSKQSLRWGLYFLLISVIIVFNNDVQQFIYFQF
jgi:alginate O-acetyltransferase complex protein AlgI